MAKILKDIEIADIVRRTIQDDELDTIDQHLEFLTDISLVLTKHFGGKFSSVGKDPELGFTSAIRHDENVPPDGGIWKHYDKDVDWSDEETWDEHTETDAEYWDEDPNHPMDDWKYQVQNGDTRMGYWEWVANEKEAVNEDG